MASPCVVVDSVDVVISATYQVSVFFAFNSATCLFVVVVCDMFVYIWHSFISAMCLFKSVFGLTVYVYSCVCNSATCLFIMVVCYPAQHIRL